MNLAPQGIVGWGEVEGADLGPLPIEAQHVGMSESVHTLKIKDGGGGDSCLSLSHLSVSHLRPPLQVKWDDLMCGPVGVGNGVGG